MMQKLWILMAGLVCCTPMAVPYATAAPGTNSYTQTNLVSDTAGMAKVTDPNLINPWGVAFVPGNPFWIADNNSGLSTLYDRHGTIQSSPFTVPPPKGSSNLATPTGIVANTGGGFNVNGHSSVFIFDTEDGTISGWNTVGSAAILAVDNSLSGAVYKGLAMISNGSGTFLLAANFNSGAVEVYDTNFHLATLTGSFTDPTIPASFAPFGIHIVNSQVVVTYAQQDQAKHDPVHAAAAGYVSLFALDGTFVRRIASQGNLNAPWGVTMAPAGFGSLGGDLLVGNFGDGVINAYDFSSGNFIDQMKDSNGTVITNASLWDMVFDASGQTGDPNTMYVTAGLANEKHGLFAAITANAAAPPPTADFSVAASPMAMTIPAGQTASYTVTVGGLNGFNGMVSFSCSGQPVGTSCAFSPATVSPQSGASATTMVSIGTSSKPYHPASLDRHMMGILPIGVLPAGSGPFGDGPFGGALWNGSTRGLRVPGPLAASPALVGLALLVLAIVAILADRSNLAVRFADNRRLRWGFAGVAGVLFMLVALAGAAGCGGGTANMQPSGTPRGATTIMITGTSGSVSHSVSVSLTVQ
jgi:uncharacterized protein (TIGR03118 family)